MLVRSKGMSVAFGYFLRCLISAAIGSSVAKDNREEFASNEFEATG